MNTNCPVTHGNLMAYRDGELAGYARWRVARHLQRCAACRKEIEIMNQIAEELQVDEAKTETERLSPTLRDRILAEAPAVTPPAHDTPLQDLTDAPVQKPKFRPVALEWGAVGVACLLFIVFSVSFMGRRVSNTFNAASNSLSTGDERYDSRGRTSADVDAGSPVSSSAESMSDMPMSDMPMPAAPPSGSAAPASALPLDRIARREPMPSAKPGIPIRGKQPVTGGSTSTDELPSALRKVDKRANITVEVEQVEQSGASVESMIVSVGGFVSNNTLSTGANGLKSASLAVRVPVEKFENILAQIGELGEVKAKNVTGEDITERYSDAEQENRVLGSELNVREAQLQQALKRESASLKEMDERERAAFRSKIPWQQRSEVRQLRVQVAQARARFELLRRVAALSSIEVVLREKPPVPGQTGLLQEIGATGRDALTSFLLAVRIPLNLLIWILAYAPIWLPLLLVYRYLARRYSQAVPKG